MFLVSVWGRDSLFYDHYVEAEDDLTALQLCAAVIPADHMVIDIRRL